MTSRTLLLLGCALLAATTLSVPAQPVNVAPPAYPTQTPDQLQTLVSPIALYPDPLISTILPASTVPGEVVLAARFVRAGNDPAAVEAQPWDESVKAVAHYPELVSWMDDNLQWTQQLGAAFLDQPADVMNTIQQLRQEARAAGILVDTPQQQVIVQQNYVSILPAQPDVIYVPTYDPQIFFEPRRYSRSAISFGLSFSTGPWLSYEPDWNRRSIWIDRRDWNTRRNWRTSVAPATGIAGVPRQTWRPSVEISRQERAPAPTYNSTTTINNTVVTRAPAPQPAPLSRTSRFESRRAPNVEVARPPVEAPLTPTGRVTEPPRAERASRFETPAPAPAPAPNVRAEPSRALEERNRERAPVYAPGTPAPSARPAPAPQAQPNRPQVEPRKAQPEPKGKAKGHEREDDRDDDGKKDDEQRRRGDG